MNSENSETSEPYVLIFKLTDKLDLTRGEKSIADPRAIQQINFTANLGRVGNTKIHFILEEAKETVLDFSQGTVIE